MRPADEIHVMFLKEARNHIGSESEGDATIVFAPACDVFVGIRPQQIAQETAVRNLDSSASNTVGF